MGRRRNGTVVLILSFGGELGLNALTILLSERRVTTGAVPRRSAKKTGLSISILRYMLVAIEHSKFRYISWYFDTVICFYIFLLSDWEGFRCFDEG